MRVFSTVTCTLAFCGLVWAASSAEGGILKAAVVGTAQVGGTVVKVGVDVGSTLVGTVADVGQVAVDGMATTLGTAVKGTSHIITTVSGGTAKAVKNIPVVGKVAAGGHLVTSKVVGGAETLLLGGGRLIQEGVNGSLGWTKNAVNKDAQYVSGLVDRILDRVESPRGHEEKKRH